MMRWLLLVIFAFSLTAAAQDQEEHNVPFTLSIFGPISTNPLSYEKTTNFFCLGLINCASSNVNGLSLAYGYNRVYQNMHGVTFGMFGNFVSGAGTGIELAFGLNVNAGSFRGLQLAPINITGGENRGLQFGFLNYAYQGQIGLQLAFVNVSSGYNRGFQTGLVNYSHGAMHGMQLAAVNASGDKTKGVQAAFFANVSAEAVTGLQLSILNIAGGEDSEGAAAVQLGFINVSNQSRVIPVGFINIVRGGRFSLDLNRDILGFQNIALVTGSRYFYSIFDLDSRGINPSKRESYHQSASLFRSLGFGAAAPINDKTSLNLEWISYSPTNFERDGVTIWKLKAEFSPRPYFGYYAGVEQLYFDKEAKYRSSVLSAFPKEMYSLTAGVVFNLMAWWQAEQVKE